MASCGGCNAQELVHLLCYNLHQHIFLRVLVFSNHFLWLLMLSKTQFTRQVLMLRSDFVLLFTLSLNATAIRHV